MQDTSNAERKNRGNGQKFVGRKSRTLPMILLMLVALVAFMALVSPFIGEAQAT
jgi:hypothetical protein